MTIYRLSNFFPLLFQSTHLHEVWPSFTSITSITTGFNPHTYMRCDRDIELFFKRLRSFNPHTYMRCDLFVNPIALFADCFNPHTYMRCDMDKKKIIYKIIVSIHTPTWGVTVIFLCICIEILVSIHTPTWGVTTHFQQSFSCKRCFNPHTYMRCD